MNILPFVFIVVVYLQKHMTVSKIYKMEKLWDKTQNHKQINWAIQSKILIASQFKSIRFKIFDFAFQKNVKLDIVTFRVTISKYLFLSFKIRLHAENPPHMLPGSAFKDSAVELNWHPTYYQPR